MTDQTNTELKTIDVTKAVLVLGGRPRGSRNGPRHCR